MKKGFSLFAVVLICAWLFAGCTNNEKADNKDGDYSQYSFVGISWTRDADNDIETIRFDADGGFAYYCACGNPVNDSDLCEGYTYDDKTKTITLECMETTDEMVSAMEIIKCDENELHLDFNGEVRIFTK